MRQTTDDVGLLRQGQRRQRTADLMRRALASKAKKLDAAAKLAKRRARKAERLARRKGR